jgi:hypothetical protein
MIPYNQILKQAYAILRTHKFLWALGLFLFWDMAANVVSYQMNLSSNPMPEIRGGWVSIVVGIILAIIFIQLAFRAKAGIISGTKSILDKKPLNFSKAFAQGRRFYVRLFGIWFITLVILGLVGLILAAPVGYLYTINYADRAVLLGLFALLIFIPISIIINFINNIAPMYVVLYDMPLGRAFGASLDTIRKFWIMFLFFSLWLGLLSFAASFLAVLMGGSGVVFLVQIFYNSAGIHFTFGSILLAICGIIAFLIFAGAIAAFQQIAWVLLFEKLIRPQKIEEVEPLPMPEVIS